MSREKILAKVQKLLDMAKHAASNEHEASTALRQAEAIMRKHDIEFAEIEAQTLSESDMEQMFSNEKRNSKWVWNLAWAASYLTSTMPYKRRNPNGFDYIVFCGTKQDTQVAMMMFDYLVNVTERLAKEFWGDRTERNSFKAGAAIAILNNASKIKIERERDLREASATTGTDLVLVKNDLIIKEFNLSYSASPQKQYIGNEKAYREGYQKGSGVSLNSQITATAT